MKKITLIAAALGMAIAANAEGLNIKAVGYDQNLGHVTARLGLATNAALDLGVGLNYDNSQANSDAKLQFGVSAFYLSHLQHWGPVDNYIAVGGVLSKLPVATKNIALSIFAGFQPEVTLLEHIVVSTRFGLNVPLMPDVMFQTAGQGISIVNGLNFKILW